jgi:hypothetical protein
MRFARLRVGPRQVVLQHRSAIEYASGLTPGVLEQIGSDAELISRMVGET